MTRLAGGEKKRLFWRLLPIAILEVKDLDTLPIASFMPNSRLRSCCFINNPAPVRQNPIFYEGLCLILEILLFFQRDYG